MIRVARAKHAIVALVVGCAVALVALKTAAVLRDRRDAQHNAGIVALNLATVLAAQADNLLATADFAGKQASVLLDPDRLAAANTLTIHEALVDLVRQFPYVTSIWVGDASGRAVVTSRQHPTPALSAADRPYYTVIRDNPDAFYVGLLPDNRYVDEVLINTAQALRASDGAFAGFVQVAISPDDLRRLYADLMSEDGTVFWLLGPDLVPLLRQPSTSIDLLTAAPTRAAFDAIEGRDEGVVDGLLPIDREPSLFGFHRLATYGGYVVVSAPAREIRSVWVRQAGTYFALSVPALIVIGLLGWIAYRRTIALRTLVEGLDRQVGERTVALEEALEHKNVLMREVNHRIKNSLQLISSMLNLEISESDDPGVAARFREVRSRVQTVARLHERLYLGERYDKVALGPYLRAVCSDLQGSVAGAQHRVRLDEENAVAVPTNMAVQLGIIISELVINAIKHGYDADGHGVVRVVLRTPVDTTLAVSVVDDGRGLPPDFDIAEAPGLGFQLARALGRQLGSELSHRSLEDGGSCFNLRVPLDPQDAAQEPPRPVGATA